MITTGIITVSDRAARGQYTDLSGPALKDFCERQGWRVAAQAVVPDEAELIQERILDLGRACSVVLLTGGTGIAARDVTPEALQALTTRVLPGFGEAMRARSFARFPHAILSRGLAAVVGQSLVVCLPGSPKGAVECLEAVAGAIPHAVELLSGASAHSSGSEPPSP